MHLRLSEAEATTAAVKPSSATFSVYSGNQGECERIGEGIPAHGGTAPKFCRFYKLGFLPLPFVEHTKLRSCTSVG